MTADGLLVCVKDNNLSYKCLNSAVFMVFLADYKSCSKLINELINQLNIFSQYQP